MPQTPTVGVSLRSRQLDGLRGLAALAVITHHFPPVDLPRIDLGRIGVTLFFVLSGFLISRILLSLRESLPRIPRAEAFRIFYARRALRILPLYYAVLLATTLFDSRMRRTFIWHAFYLSNVKISYDGSLDSIPMNHFWSLAVEEQFYLFWPAILLLLPRAFFSRTLPAIAAVGPISRFALWYWSGNYQTAMFFSTSWLDALGLGAILAWIRWSQGVGDERSGNAYSNLAAVSGLSIITIYLLAATIIPSRFWTFAVYVTIVPLGWALISVWFVARASSGFRGNVGRLLAFRPVVWLGLVSYGLYIYHPVIPRLSRAFLATLVPWLSVENLPAPMRWGVVIGLSTLVASLSWVLFERPLNALNRHLPYPDSIVERGGQSQMRTIARSRELPPCLLQRGMSSERWTQAPQPGEPRRLTGHRVWTSSPNATNLRRNIPPKKRSRHASR